MISAPHSVQISLDGKARSQGKTAAAASCTSVSRRKWQGQDLSWNDQIWLHESNQNGT